VLLRVCLGPSGTFFLRVIRNKSLLFAFITRLENPVSHDFVENPDERKKEGRQE
jgi:hypothetical protein